MSAILRIQDYCLTISSNHNETAVLKDINLTLQESQVIALIGQSGSGKTMLSLSIADLLYTVKAKQSGSIEYFDGDKFVNILELSAKEITAYRRTFVSYIFQDSLSSLNPAKTCGWQIDESLKLSQQNLKSQDRKTMVLQALSDVDLDDADRIYNSYPHELSGGQLQRVMIAMTIIQRPRLIIADEPTSSLDQETETIVLDLIKRLQDQYGFALLFISHDLDLVHSFCDRIIMMENGSILQNVDLEKSLIEHKHKLNHQYKKSLTKESNLESDIVLSLSNVSHHYKKRKSLFGKSITIPSLKNVTFSVRKSEILGLVGPSGSGKSTIAKLLTGFAYPTSGEIQFGSIDLVKAWKNNSKSPREKIQIIFQNPFSSLNPKQRVGDCLQEVLSARLHNSTSDVKQEVNELLNSVGLLDQFLNRLPHQMSGGQQQRVSIARALAMKPEILICDECVSALDTITKYDFLDLLHKLRYDKDLTIIFISHDQNAVNYVCDRVIHLKEGTIIDPVL